MIDGMMLEAIIKQWGFSSTTRTEFIRRGTNDVICLPDDGYVVRVGTFSSRGIRRVLQSGGIIGPSWKSSSSPEKTYAG